MNLLQEFLWQIQVTCNAADTEDIEFDSDYSDFTIVDGEEGDHGTIRYYDKVYGHLLAENEVYGGDSNEITFTPFGVMRFREMTMKIVMKKIDSLETTGF